MSQKLRAAILVSMLLLVLPMMIASIAHAAVPAMMSFQGRLTDAGGVPLEGTFSVQFTIYDHFETGVVKWQETQSVTTNSDGTFAVILGSVSPLMDSVFIGCQPSLGIKIGADPEMTPRTRLITVPYAYLVSTIEGARGGVLTSKLTIGSQNTNTADYGFVAGSSNTVSGDYATIPGGNWNEATGDLSAVGGGQGNVAGGNYSTVGGGNHNSAGLESVVAGGYYNYAGGYFSTVTGGVRDTVTGYNGTIGGGYYNFAGDTSATVAGGAYNRAAGRYAAICGGRTNIASGYASTVPGGERDTASGRFSFAAGRNASARHSGSFVWADSSVSTFASTINNQFSVRASGGTRIYSNSSLTAGVILFAGSSSWSSVSDSTLKQNIRPVDGADILRRLDGISISRWNYKSQSPGIEHIGPMAQDFYAAFGLGEDNTHINSLDPDGVALAAIQELSRQNNELKRENEIMKSRLDELERKIEQLYSAGD